MIKHFIFKKKLAFVYVILFLVLFVSIAGEVVLSCLSSAKIYLYYNGCMNDNIQHILLYFIVISFGVLFLFVCTNRLSKIIIGVVCVLLIVVFTLFSGGFWETDKAYFEFQSPSKDKTIVVEEWTWLLGGGANVYEKTNSHIINKLDGYISTDDGYAPFSKNQYKIEWYSDSVKIDYSFRGDGIDKSETYRLR